MGSEILGSNKYQDGGFNAAGPQAIKELHGANPTGLGSRPHLLNELRARDVDEIDGVQILEIADKTE